MKGLNINQRVGVFVDVSNLYHSAKNLYRAKVNFGQVLRSAVGERQLVRSIAYVIRADVDQEQAFFDALTNSGFEVREKDLQVFAGGAKKGDWDVGLALEAIKIATHLDVVIIVSGDGDFLPLVLYLKENKGCRVEVVGFGKTTSGRLADEADSFLDLDKDRAFLITSRRRVEEEK